MVNRYVNERHLSVVNKLRDRAGYYEAYVNGILVSSGPAAILGPELNMKPNTIMSKATKYAKKEDSINISRAGEYRKIYRYTSREGKEFTGTIEHIAKVAGKTQKQLRHAAAVKGNRRDFFEKMHTVIEGVEK